MTSRAITRTAGVCGLLLLLAACGGSSGGTSTGAPPTGTPTNGGTLKLLGSGDVDHLDPASAYYTVSYTLERAFTRQLVSYPASSDLTTATTVAPDLATSLPTTSNGGITNGDKTYTFHLRTDAQWNTSPARAVTAADVVRGLQRICNPASPSGGLTYYEDTIAGFTQFCDGFAKVNAADPAAMAKLHERPPDLWGHDAGRVHRGDQPDQAGQRLPQHPGPAVRVGGAGEYLKYVPDGATFRQHTLSDGPYAITSYQPGRSIVLDRNPAWTQASDPLRHQHVATIDITQGQGSDQAVQQQLQAGTADLSWDLPVPTAALPALKASNNPNLEIFPSASNNPYLVFNLLSPNNKGALANVKVRQALEYAIDKTAIGKIYGGPTPEHAAGPGDPSGPGRLPAVRPLPDGRAQR